MNDDEFRMVFFIGSAVIIACLVAAHMLGRWVVM